jgi:tetratricopeptide (TPR) repeat protein
MFQDKHLLATRERIELANENAIWSDIARFRQLLEETKGHQHTALDNCELCLSSLGEAIEIYQGEFMAGFSLRDSAAFDDWQFFQREELRRELAAALEILARSHRQKGAFGNAIDFAHRWLKLDPLVEDAHRELMRCFALSGQRNAALRQYKECTRILEKELGVSPLEETTDLYQSILQNRINPQNPKNQDITETAVIRKKSQAEETLLTTISQPSAGNLYYPLVGRSHESEALVQAYLKHASKGYILTLEGEAGIGKTRLAEEFLASVQAQGAFIIKGRCYEGESNLAFSPLVDALNGVLMEEEHRSALLEVSAQNLSEAGRLLTTLTRFFPDLPEPAQMSSPGAQALFYEGLRQVILHSSKGRMPGILFLDDLQWADSATLDFLAYLMRRLPGQSLFLLMTWRSEEPAGIHLHTMLAESQRSGHAVILKLDRLQLRDVTELIRVITSNNFPLPADFDERLFQESEGLPYFLVAYLDALLQKSVEGIYTDNETLRWEMPETVRDLLRVRLQHVDELSHQILVTAAVIGRSFDFDTLNNASGRSEMETIAGLESLLAHGIIEECSSCDTTNPIYYDFTHEKLRNLVYEEASLIRRKLLHRRVAEALFNQRRNFQNPGTLESKIAHHYHLAGADDLSAEHYKLAGDYARSLFANQEAMKNYQAALECGHPDRTGLYESLGDLHILSGEYYPALECYSQASHKASKSKLAVLQHKIGQVYQRQGMWERAMGYFREALNGPEPSANPGLHARILADWSLVEYQLGKPREAQELAQKALDYSNRTQERSASVQAHNLLGILARSQAQYDLARRELMLSLDHATEIGDESARAAALNNLALVLADTGDVGKALEATSQALEICERLGDRHRAAALHSNLADLLHQIGMDDQAMENLKEAVAIFAEIGEQASELQPEIWKLTEW